MKLVEENSKEWYKELERFINDPDYKVPATIVNEWKANEDPFSKRAIKNNASNQLFLNILTWRRMIIRLYESSRQKGLPTFVEHREIVKDENNKTKALATKTKEEYELKNDADYNFICLKSIYVLYFIHSRGEYDNQSFEDKYENQIKGFISTYLSFSYKKPYIQYDYQEFTDLFKEEEEYFKNL